MYSQYINITFSIGNYGACNVAFSKIDNTSDANNYCENCNYGDDTYPPDSYQNEYGFASGKIEFNLLFFINY